MASVTAFSTVLDGCLWTMTISQAASGESFVMSVTRESLGEVLKIRFSTSKPPGICAQRSMAETLVKEK